MNFRWRVGLHLGLGWMTLSSAAWPAAPRAEPAPPVNATAVGNPLRLTVLDAMLGIIAHTRWPARTARPLSLCVNEASPLAADLKSLPESLPPGKLAPVRLIDLDDELPLDCDLVYIGQAAAAGAGALAQLIGRPVLSLGDGADFCSRGGMFCLVPTASGLRVEVNLDTVARSGLHVHPQVLKIGQPRPGASP